MGFPVLLSRVRPCRISHKLRQPAGELRDMLLLWSDPACWLAASLWGTLNWLSLKRKSSPPSNTQRLTGFGFVVQRLQKWSTTSPTFPLFAAQNSSSASPLPTVQNTSRSARMDFQPPLDTSVQSLTQYTKTPEISTNINVSTSTS